MEGLGFSHLEGLEEELKQLSSRPVKQHIGAQLLEVELLRRLQSPEKKQAAPARRRPSDAEFHALYADIRDKLVAHGAADPSHTELRAGVAYRGSLEPGASQLFVYRPPATNAGKALLRLEAESGDPDLFASTATERPSREENMWSSTTDGSEALVVPIEDHRPVYIAVYAAGLQPAAFKLTANARAHIDLNKDDPAAAEGALRRGESAYFRVSHQSAKQSFRIRLRAPAAPDACLFVCNKNPYPSAEHHRWKSEAEVDEEEVVQIWPSDKGFALGWYFVTVYLPPPAASPAGGLGAAAAAPAPGHDATVPFALRASSVGVASTPPSGGSFGKGKPPRPVSAGSLAPAAAAAAAAISAAGDEGPPSPRGGGQPAGGASLPPRPPRRLSAGSASHRTLAHAPSRPKSGAAGVLAGLAKPVLEAEAAAADAQHRSERARALLRRGGGGSGDLEPAAAPPPLPPDDSDRTSPARAPRRALSAPPGSASARAPLPPPRVPLAPALPPSAGYYRPGAGPAPEAAHRAPDLARTRPLSRTARIHEAGRLPLKALAAAAEREWEMPRPIADAIPAPLSDEGLRRASSQPLAPLQLQRAPSLPPSPALRPTSVPAAPARLAPLEPPPGPASAPHSRHASRSPSPRPPRRHSEAGAAEPEPPLEAGREGPAEGASLLPPDPTEAIFRHMAESELMRQALGVPSSQFVRPTAVENYTVIRRREAAAATAAHTPQRPHSQAAQLHGTPPLSNRSAAALPSPPSPMTTSPSMPALRAAPAHAGAWMSRLLPRAGPYVAGHRSTSPTKTDHS